jgi:flagellar motor switch protein FliN
MGNLETFDIRPHVIASIIEVFETMVSTEIVPSDSEPEYTEGIDRMGVGVNLAGNVAGILNIQVNSELAHRMTANMLDMQPADLDDDDQVKDLLCEICNFVGGRLKSALNDAGLPCELSMPSGTQGGDVTIRSLNMERFERFVFRCEQDWIIVEVGVSNRQDEDSLQSGAEDSPTEQGSRTTNDAQGQSDAGEAGSDSAKTSQYEIDAAPDESNAEKSSGSPSTPAAAPQDPFPSAEQASRSYEDVDLDLLLDIPLEIKVELGRAKIEIQELLNLVPGSAVKLTKLEGEPVDILANETLIAKGEVVVHREKYGIRVTEITSRIDRIRSFGL